MATGGCRITAANIYVCTKHVGKIFHTEITLRHYMKRDTSSLPLASPVARNVTVHVSCPRQTCLPKIFGMFAMCSCASVLLSSEI